MTYTFDPTQGLIIVPVRLFGPAPFAGSKHWVDRLKIF
jgi:hypothetical protein